MNKVFDVNGYLWALDPESVGASVRRLASRDFGVPPEKIAVSEIPGQYGPWISVQAEVADTP